MTYIADLSAVALAAAIRRRELSPVEAARAALDRIQERADLNAFLTVDGEMVLHDAKAAEAAVMDGRELGPLHGVPVSVKDLINTAGLRTTFGSALFEQNVPSSDAVSVARTRAAGGIVLGKTTTPEFGHKPLTEAPIFGRTLNPTDRSVTCGGSSGGAAVAVATGMGPLAIGSDGGGSIRIPAACCGVVGLKPTLGAIPHLQVPDLFGANSYVGPMARDVADTRLLFEALLGPDSADPYGQALPPASAGDDAVEPRRLAVAWLPRCGNALDPEVESLTTGAVRRLEQAGAAIETVECDFVALESSFLVILESALAARVGDRLPEWWNRLDPSLVKTVEKGLRHSAVALQLAAAARSEMFRTIQRLFGRFDVLISPALSAPPLPVDQDPHGSVVIDGRDRGPIRGAWYPYTYPFNLTGHPALALPCGTTREALPVGLQLVGPWHSDRKLIALARWLEHSFD
jgi:aspartyl-tRNA(Asn)/glutamyl-tRNA(Gln) amidotransferase subunit A